MVLRGTQKSMFKTVNLKSGIGSYNSDFYDDYDDDVNNEKQNSSVKMSTQ